MEQTKRKTGIESIGDVPWGSHFCLFYQTKEDLTDILVPYLKAGLENNEFCMWVTSEPLSVEDAKRSLKRVVENLDDSIEKGQIEILDYSQWYTQSGKFEADKVLQGWVEKEKQAVKRGFDGFRLTGNRFWLEKEDWRGFTAYEARIDGLIGQYRMLALCTYSLDRCEASEIIDVVSNHELALIRRQGEWETIQSAKRKWAVQALREKEEFSRALFEYNPVVTVVVDREGKVTMSNRAKMKSGDRLPNIGDVMYKDYAGKHECDMYGELMECIQSGRSKEFPELKYQQKFLSITIAPFPEGAIITSQDITERKRAEEALGYRLEFEKLVTSISTQFISTTADDIPSRMSDTLRRIAQFVSADRSYILLFSNDETKIDDVYEWCAEEIEPHVSRRKGVSVGALPWVAESMKQSQTLCIRRVADLPHETGAEKEYFQKDAVQSVVAVPMVLGGKVIGILGFDSVRQEKAWSEDIILLLRIVGQILADVVQRKRAEERLMAYQENLRSLASELSLVEERERRQIASFLHDEIGQSLAAIRMKFAALRQAGGSADIAGMVDEIQALLEWTIRDTRSLTFELSPPILYELGLEAALEWLGEKIGEEHGIRIEFEDDAHSKPLEDDVRGLLFRAVDELLINIVKHANTRSGKVSILRDGDHVRIVVEDDGVGFDATEIGSRTSQDRGFGLFSIRERLGYIGGCVEVESERGHGTRVTLIAPLRGDPLARKGGAP